MKRGFLRTIPVLLLPVILLSSCRYGTIRTNAIEAGVFAGQDSTGEYDCTFVVEEITDVEYVKAEGVNVLKDAVEGGYYRVAFSAIGKDGNTLTYDFVSLRDPYNGSPRTYAAYIDDNKAWIEPTDPKTQTHEEHVTYYVVIYIDKTRFSATNLKWVDPLILE